MKRSAGFSDILIDLIEDRQDEIEALDPEFLEGGSARAEEKYDALWSGNLGLAMSLTSNYRLMTIFQEIEEEIKSLPRTRNLRSASEIIRSLEMRVARLEGKTASSKKASAVGDIIVQQLGGSRKLQMMIGLKQIIGEPNGVTLVFPKPKHRGAVNRVRITLNGMDLYDMEFIRTHGRSVKVVKEFNDVFAEDIRDRFEDGTGLYIRL